MHTNTTSSMSSSSQAKLLSLLVPKSQLLLRASAVWEECLDMCVHAHTWAFLCVCLWCVRQPVKWISNQSHSPGLYSETSFQNINALLKPEHPKFTTDTPNTWCIFQRDTNLNYHMVLWDNEEIKGMSEEGRWAVLRWMKINLVWPRFRTEWIKGYRWTYQAAHPYWIYHQNI